jgi:hypothetical protein
MSSRTKSDAVRCTAQKPCQHCQRHDHMCWVREDGSDSGCYRTGDGGGVQEQDSGGRTWWHFQHAAGVGANGDSRAEGRPKPRRTPPGLPDYDTWNEVYSFLLNDPRLTLCDFHREKLRARGLADDQIDRLGYKTAPGDIREDVAFDIKRKFDLDIFLSVPGLYRNSKNSLTLAIGYGSGILVPLRDLDARIISLVMRSDDGIMTNAGQPLPKYFLLSSLKHDGPGPGSHAHIPLGVAGPADLVVITEGVLKADVIHALCGEAVVGAPGVGGWPKALAAAQALGAKRMRIAFDADWKRKADVARALHDLGRAVLAAGLEIELASWDEADGKGLDDLLAAGKAPEIVAGEAAVADLQAAAAVAGVTTEPEGPAPIDPQTLIDQAERFRSDDDLKALLGARQFHADLARLEIQDPAAAAVIDATIREIRKFKVGPFKKVMEKHRRDARKEDRDRRKAEMNLGDRAPVIISAYEISTNDEVIDALTDAPDLYQRGNMLVGVMRDEVRRKKHDPIRPPGTPRIALVPLPKLREMMTRYVQFLDFKSDGEGGSELVPAHPPDWTVKAVAARGEWPNIRPIDAVVEHPTIRPDGSILSIPGWDEQTNLLYEPNAEFPPVPTSPSREDAKKAANSLLEIVKEFPFEDQYHKAVWLAASLTVIGRHAIQGPTPIFLFDSNTPGSGKGLLCDVIAVCATGRDAGKCGYPEDEAEMEKLLFSVALAGDPILLFDNVATGFLIGGKAVDRAATATVMKGRILGKSQTLEMPWTTVLFATGNNLGLRGDSLRRVVPSRLQSPLEHPEERDDFTIKDLLDHARKNRGRLVIDALTILRAHALAGYPADPTLKPMDYRPWCKVVRHAVHWATGTDPCQARAKLVQDDPELNVLRGLLEGWAGLEGGDAYPGITATEALDQLEATATAPRAILEILYGWSQRDELPSSRVVGRHLREIKGRVIRDSEGKFNLYLDSEPYQGITRWWVAKAE